MENFHVVGNGRVVAGWLSADAAKVVAGRALKLEPSAVIAVLSTEACEEQGLQDDRGRDINRALGLKVGAVL